jgi:putative oxidoreductase
MRRRTSTAPAATILIRAMVGAVFLSEGIQKFLYAESVGAGRFARIGIPQPDLVAPSWAPLKSCAARSYCSASSRAGRSFRCSASCSWRSSRRSSRSCSGRTSAPFASQLSYYGFWAAAHESRTDFSMVMGSLFLWFAGAGPISLDARRR